MDIQTMLSELEIKLIENELLAHELHAFKNTEAIDELLAPEHEDVNEMAQWALENIKVA